MSSLFPYPRLDPTGTMLITGYEFGTPLVWFDLSMALQPGLSEATYLAQIAKALAYWSAIVTAGKADGDTMLRATYAVTWLTAEQARVSNPPANNMHIIYPV